MYLCFNRPIAASPLSLERNTRHWISLLQMRTQRSPGSKVWNICWRSSVRLTWPLSKRCESDSWSIMHELVPHYLIICNLIPLISCNLLLSHWYLAWDYAGLDSCLKIISDHVQMLLTWSLLWGDQKKYLPFERHTNRMCNAWARLNLSVPM